VFEATAGRQTVPNYHLLLMLLSIKITKQSTTSCVLAETCQMDTLPHCLHIAPADHTIHPYRLFHCLQHDQQQNSNKYCHRTTNNTVVFECIGWTNAGTTTLLGNVAHARYINHKHENKTKTNKQTTTIILIDISFTLVFCCRCVPDVRHILVGDAGLQFSQHP
jgi:hypothetical protein